jgi:hypothetical protein
VTYTVRAADGSSQGYVVTVGSPTPTIGDPYQGGFVFYILQSGDSGYVAGETHGLIAAPADVGTLAWSTVTGVEVGPAARGFLIGAGRANTLAIVSQPGCTGGAAYACYSCTAGGYTDWYLPDELELSALWEHRLSVPGLMPAGYWTSSEHNWAGVQMQDFSDGSKAEAIKSSPYLVRPVRSF